MKSQRTIPTKPNRTNLIREMQRLLDIVSEICGGNFARSQVTVEDIGELRRLIMGVYPSFLNVVERERPHLHLRLNSIDWRRLLELTIAPILSLPIVNPPSGGDSGEGSHVSETGSASDYSTKKKDGEGSETKIEGCPDHKTPRTEEQ